MRRAIRFALILLLPALARAATLSLELHDAAGAPLAGAVVALEQPGLARRAKAGTQAEMAQRDRQFVPRLLVVQTGTAVNFPNQDRVRHHVFSYSVTKPFELKLYLGAAAAPVLFDQPGVVTLGCNIHDRMSAYVVVVDTPHFALTETGRAELPSLPEGRYVVRVWYEGQRRELEAQPVTLAGNERRALTFQAER